MTTAEGEVDERRETRRGWRVNIRPNTLEQCNDCHLRRGEEAVGL